MLHAAIPFETEELAHAQSAARAAVARLDPEETSILERVLEGCSWADIGQALGRSDREMSALRETLMARLGANATADLVRIAIYAGLDRPEQ